MAFRPQAALTGNRKWSAINTTLYSMCFTGRATRACRCEICFASTHTERECAQHKDPDPDVTSRMKSPRAAAAGLPVHPSGETCRKWNSATGCTFPRCRHSHACSSCGGGGGGLTRPPVVAGDAWTRSHAAIRGHTADPPILRTPSYQGRGYEQLLSSYKIGNINCDVWDTGTE